MKALSRSLAAVFGLMISFSSFAGVPAYNSYPSAAATIYLDFDGHLVNGTSWNYKGPITCEPSNMTEAQITEIFNRVAEDYRPFNVNITTDSTRYWSAPLFQRMRVIFTISSSWYGSAGGVSYIGSFSWGDNTPCFIFTALLNYKTKSVAEAASHEVGHTLGLNHQSAYNASCTKIAEYNPGTGTGEIGWAPIMGYSYAKNLTLWHNGSNPYGCTRYQDDLAIIAGSNNGFGFRADDFADEANAAAPPSFTGNQFSVNGIIEKITDRDVFKFSVPSQSNFHLDARPYSVGSSDNGSNLDIKVQLLSGASDTATYNPDHLLSASIDTILDAGTYYLSIQSVGNAYAPDYATLGSYTLSASMAPLTTLPVHRLDLRGTAHGGKHSFDWLIDADESVVQQVLEVSRNGRDFQPLGTVNTNERTYSYAPNSNGILYYRLNVSFDNNRQYFSNTVALRTTTERPRVIGNPVQALVQISSPSAFNYTMVDLSGRTVMKGSLVPGTNTVSVQDLNRGMYIISFSNGQEQFAEKITKQ